MGSPAAADAARPRGGGTEGVRCPNCGASGVGRYCPACGQEQGPQVLSLRHWGAQLADDYLSLDGRVPRSLLALILQPGLLTREWHEGRRARYTPPLRLLLLSTLFLFAIVQIGEEGSRTLGELGPIFALATAPLMAWVTGVLERSSGRVYVEHLVFVSHVLSFVFVFSGFVFAWVFLVSDFAMVGAPADWIFRGLVILYITKAFVRTYSDSWGWAAAKAALFGTVLFISFLAFTLIGTYAARSTLAALGLEPS